MDNRSHFFEFKFNSIGRIWISGAMSISPYKLDDNWSLTSTKRPPELDDISNLYGGL